MFNIHDLTYRAKVKLLKQICQEILNEDNEDLEMNCDDLLESLIRTLDTQDMDDMWGTEGWKHRFGLED